MSFKNNKFYIYFVDLFPSIIMQNQIVVNIINIVGIKLLLKKDEIDNNINYDI